MSKVKVAEQFYSIQGEGPYAGTPAIFLRVVGCNLSCGVKPEELPPVDAPQREYEARQADNASWTCDTLSVWRPSGSTYEPIDLAHDWEGRDWLDDLRRGAHIVLTGGEPTLRAHQNALYDFVMTLNDVFDCSPFVEVETNGTQNLQPNFMGVTDHFNVSLKLANSGMEHERRISPLAIDQYVAMQQDDSQPDAKFKFVVGSTDDLEEIYALTTKYKIPDSMVSLMPAGASQEQLRETYPVVAEVCKQSGWDFSPRLHVDVWDMATGV